MAKIVEEVEKLIEPIAISIGLEVVDIEYSKKYNGYNLSIFIDKQGGILVEDCEKLHNLIDAPLDELNPTNDVPYILNVSSCGIDRPLVKLKDYLRNVGSKVELKFYAPYNGKKVIEASIVNANEKEVVVNDGKEELTIEMNKIASCLPVIEF